MGQELSCTSRGGKGFSLEDGFDNVVDGVEQAADTVEQVINDFGREPPASTQCELSDKERAAAVNLFWQLVREQGDNVTGSTAVVFEDAAMAVCLHRLRVLSSTAPTATSDDVALHEPDDEPTVEAMKRRLHAFPIGKYLKADPSRRAYTVDQWVALVRLPRTRRAPLAHAVREHPFGA